MNIVEVISEAKSAKEPYVRPEFDRLMSLIRKGEIHGILCWKIDRLSRNPIDNSTILWALQKEKIKSIKTSDRTYLPEDNILLMAIEQSMANQYIRDLSKNVKRGLLSKAEKGWCPGVAPIGYLNTNSRRKGLEEVIIDPERFETVRKMWDMILTGNYTVMDVLRKAKYEWKLITPAHKKLGNVPFTRSAMYRMFSNIFYTGNFMYGGKLYAGNHKAMVTIAEFDAVQVILGKKDKPRPQTHRFAYTGIMRCKICGASITATEKTKFIRSTGEYKTYIYYHCTGRVKDGACTASRITVQELERQITSRLKAVTIAPQFASFAIECIKAISKEDKDDNTFLYEKQSAFVAELQQKQTRILSYLVNGTISEDEYKPQKIKLDNELTKEKLKLQEIKTSVPNYDGLLRYAFKFSEVSLHVLLNGDMEAKKEVLGNLGSNHCIGDKKIEFSMYSYLTEIKNAEKQFHAEIERLEPKTINACKSPYDLGLSFPTMCGQEDDIRSSNPATFAIVAKTIQKLKKEFKENPPVHIADLSRWTNTIP